MFLPQQNQRDFEYFFLQDAIIIKAGNFPKIIQPAGCNKSAEARFFEESFVKPFSFPKKLMVHVVVILCRLEILQRLIICTACLFDTLDYAF